MSPAAGRAPGSSFCLCDDRPAVTLRKVAVPRLAVPPAAGNRPAGRRAAGQ
jgi:hypothetical protein